MGGWLRVLGELGAELVSAEFAEPGEPAWVPDDKLLGLLKQVHTLCVETERARGEEKAERAATGVVANGAEQALVCSTAPGSCVYMWASGATSKSVRDLVSRITALPQSAQAQRDELYAELLSLRPQRAKDTPVTLCSITGVSCTRAGEEDMGEQVAAEARRLLEYARQIVRGRVLEVELHAELSGGGTGVGAPDVEAVLQHMPRREWARSLLDVLPVDEPLTHAVHAQSVQPLGGGAVSELVTPVLAALPPRLQHTAALASARHAVLQRWYRGLMKM